MPSPGDVVTVHFAGASVSKRRPAVVVSSALYHAQRPDIVLGLLTTNVAVATADTDHLLADWSAAGLNAPTAFRAYFGMALPANARQIGRLSDRDRRAVLDCVRKAMG